MYPISNSRIVPYNSAAAAAEPNSSNIQNSSNPLSFSSSSIISSSTSDVPPVVTPPPAFMPSARMPIPMMPFPWMMYSPMPMFLPSMPIPMMSMPLAPMPWPFFPPMFPLATSNSANSSQVRNEGNRSEMHDTPVVIETATTSAANLLLSLSKPSDDISPSPSRDIPKNVPKKRKKQQEQPMQRIIPEKEKDVSSASSTSSIQEPPSDVSMDNFSTPDLDFEYGTERDDEGNRIPEKIIIKKQKLKRAAGAPVGNTSVMPSSSCSKGRGEKSIEIFNKAIQFIKDCASLGSSTPSWEKYTIALEKLQYVEGDLNRDTVRKGKQLLLLLQATLKKEAEIGGKLSKEKCREFMKKNKRVIAGVKNVKISSKDFPDFMKEARKPEHKNALLDFQIPDNPNDSGRQRGI